MKAKDYLELPEYVMNEVEVTIDDKEKKVYGILKQEMIVLLKETEIDAINAASPSNKLL